MLTLLQLQMMLPAFSTILLGLFFLPGSPIYYKRDAGRGCWFCIYFLLYTVICAFTTLGSSPTPAQDTALQISSLLPQILSLLGLALLIILRFAAGRQMMERVWLAWGGWRYYLLFGLAILAFYILQAALNVWSGLGSNDLATTSAAAGLTPQALLVQGGLQMLLVPVLGIVIAFGEEYGWRGYLQNELFKLGRRRGVLLLGVIWGVWHWPAILMGHTYPDHPLLGLPLFILFTTSASIVLGYAVLKSGSVLLAAYLHSLMNTTVQILIGLGYPPYDYAFSFMVGIYGLAMMAIIALVILRDPIWQGKGSSLAQATPAPGGVTTSSRPEPVEKIAHT